MRKFYLVFLATAVLGYTHAQKLSAGAAETVRKPKFRGAVNFTEAGACDTLNLAASDAWTPTVYSTGTNGVDGYVAGTNKYGFLGEGQYFDASSTHDSYISQAYFYVAHVNSGDLTKVVPINIYDGTAGEPGDVLGTANLTMQDIKDDVDGGFFVHVVFNPAIQLPASKKFFLAMDISSLNWLATPQKDSLAIVTSRATDAGTGAWNNFGPLYGGPAWDTYPNTWTNLDIALFAFPLTSKFSTCSALPVHLVSFNAEAKGKNVSLSWQVTQETGMKQYVVERANNSLQFAPVGTVAANNSPLNHTYSFVDNDALSAGTALFYRLKQVNNDGKSSYSNIITLSSSANALNVKVVNPFKNAVQLQITAPFAQKMQGGIYDMLGRKVVTAKDQVLVAGQNSVTIPTGLLPKGMYMLNITVGKTTLKYKILN